MNSGWVKLHRKILENQFLKRDINSFKVFIMLLLLVDRKSGMWEGGRFQLAELCGLNPSTIYRVCKRLEKAKMVTLTANNKFSTILISNWSEYQDTENTAANNQRTTNEQPANTLTRSKNKEVKNNISIDILAELQKEFPTKSVNDEYEKCQDWIKANGKTYKDYKAMFRNWLRRSPDTRVIRPIIEDYEVNQANLDLLNKGKRCILN